MPFVHVAERETSVYNNRVIFPNLLPINGCRQEGQLTTGHVCRMSLSESAMRTDVRYSVAQPRCFIFNDILTAVKG